MLGCSDGDAGGERGHRLVAHVLVDDLGSAPERLRVDAARKPDPRERLGEALPGNAMERQGDGIDSTGDPVGARAHRLEARRERVAARALAVEAYGKTALLPERLHELMRTARLQRSGRVVQQHARRAHLGQGARLRDQDIGLARVARAVDEPGVELLPCPGDRLRRLAQVGDVVQRVVQAEDLDAVLGRGGDEAADEVRADGAGADEETAAERHSERRLRTVVERADSLPRALHSAAHGTVEDAAAGDLQARASGSVEDLRDLE